MSRLFFNLSFLILCFGIILTHGVVSGKELVSLRISPENVGVFVSIKTQQFQATAVFDDGSEEDYTQKVGWSIEANPFPDQDLTPEEVAQIDQNGLATVLSTWGRVRVVATYPRPFQAVSNTISALLLNRPLISRPHTLSSILGLLLGDDRAGQNVRSNALSVPNETLSMEGGEFFIERASYFYWSAFDYNLGSKMFFKIKRDFDFGKRYQIKSSPLKYQSID